MINKICHLTSVHSRYDVRIFFKECKSLAKAGYDVSLIVADGKGDEIKNDIYIYDVGKPSNRLRRIIKTTKAVYEKAVMLNAEIYHLHDPELLQYSSKLKKNGKKVIFDSHEFYGLQIQDKQYIPKFFRRIIAKTYMCYEAHACRKIDSVIQICTVNGNNYFENRCKMNAFITNVPIISNLNPSYNVLFSDRKKVIYIGSLTYSRGITHLIQASSYTDIQIILAGSWDTELYEEQVKKMHEFQNVEYIGFLDITKMNLVLDNCLAGISTLLDVGQYYQCDTLSTKIYEYMAMGLPVIFFNSPYNNLINKKFEFGICVDPSNSKEIACAIDYLKNNPDEAKKMGERGRELILNLYNWEVEEKKLLELYSIIKRQ